MITLPIGPLGRHVTASLATSSDRWGQKKKLELGKKRKRGKAELLKGGTMLQKTWVYQPVRRQTGIKKSLSGKARTG